MRGVVAFIVGSLFAFGLGISGMTKPDVVKGFLDIFGQWNYNLIGVMLGGIVVHTVAFQFIKNKKSPILDTKFYLPIKKAVDKRLLIGAAIFGLGWGWAGICPGPAIVSLASGELGIVLFVISMIFGMLLFKWFEKKNLL